MRSNLAVGKGLRVGNRMRCVLLAVLLAACSDSSGSEPTLAGDWSGTFSDGSDSYTATITIDQQGQTITASGTSTSTITTDTIPITASGTYVHPDVLLIFNAGLTYSGTRNGSSIAGTIVDGQSAYPMTFTRQ